MRHHQRIRTRICHLESLERRQLLTAAPLPVVSMPEGEDDALVEVKLDVTQNGASIIDENRRFDLSVGERFDLEVRYDDRRGAPDNVGVFVFALDIMASTAGKLRPVVSEMQVISLDNVAGATGGSVVIRAEDTTNESTISLNELGADPEATIAAAVASVLSIDPSTVRVIVSDFGNPVIVRVLFSEAHAFTQMNNLIVDTSGLTGGGSVTADVIEVPAFINGDPALGINPNALITAVDFRSSSFGGAEVYNTGGTNAGGFSSLGLPLIDDVRPFGPVLADPAGLRTVADDAGVPYTGSNIEVLSYQMEVVDAAEELQLTALPSEALAGVFLYGSLDSFPPSVMLFDIDDDPGIPGDDRPAVVIGNFAAVSMPPFQNPENRFDVDGSGGVTPFDAVPIINELENRTLIGTDGSLPDPPPDPIPFFWDVNGDNFVTIDDANDVLAELDQPLRLDYGDAPTAVQSGFANSYPTTLADNGARHRTGTLFLGSSVDVETDGIPSADADGDDTDGGDDESGVTSDAALVAGSSVQLQVNASGTGKLDAWVDFNRDGDWGDASERVISGADVTSGVNSLSINIPATATPGDVFGRFRLTSAGIDQPTGEAPDGEVEDHVFAITDAGGDVDLAIGDNTVLSVQNGEFVVTVDANEVFRQAVSTLGAVRLTGTAADQRVTFDFSTGDFAGLSQLDVDGGGGDNTLAVIGADAKLDLTAASNIAAANFATLDLSDPVPAEVTLSANVIDGLVPGDTTLRFVGDKVDDDQVEDELVFTDEADWRMTEPIVNGEFLLTATHQTEGQQIVASVLRPWRNLVSASDIDNSGDDSAADALRIINALFRREFLVAEAEQLVDPSEVGDWPGVYPDQNGDGEMTALDALRVINDLAKSGENEAPIAAALADHVLSRREELEWEESPPQSLDPQKLILVSSSQPYQDNTLREWAVEIDRSDAGAAGLPLDLADRRDALQTMEVTTTNPA